MNTNPDDLVNVGSGCIEDGGLTKREYFAGLAMQGLIGLGKRDCENIGTAAVCVADNLIKALNKEEEK